MDLPLIPTVPQRGNIAAFAHPALWKKWEQSALQAYWGPQGAGEPRHLDGTLQKTAQFGPYITPASSVVAASKDADNLLGSVAPSRVPSYPSTAATSRPLRAVPEEEQKLLETRGKEAGTSHHSGPLCCCTGNI